jgi:hypothetical protein
MKADVIARTLGIAFFVAGCLGFVPYVTLPHSMADPYLQIDANYGFLAALFPVNILHDALHMLFGIWGLGASTSFTSSVRYCKWIAWIYLVLVVLGSIPLTNTLFGAVPIYGFDVLLHALVALLALYGGYGAGRIPPEPVAELPL